MKTQLQILQNETLHNRNAIRASRRDRNKVAGLKVRGSIGEYKSSINRQIEQFLIDLAKYKSPISRQIDHLFIDLAKYKLR